VNPFHERGHYMSPRQRDPAMIPASGTRLETVLGEQRGHLAGRVGLALALFAQVPRELRQFVATRFARLPGAQCGTRLEQSLRQIVSRDTKRLEPTGREPRGAAIGYVIHD